MTSPRAFIIFSGFNSRAVITLCRVLSKYNIPFYIVALSSDDPIICSSYYHRVQWIRKNRSLDFSEMIDSINYIKHTFKLFQVTIIPSTEALNRFLLKNKVELEERGIHVPLVNEELYCLISNKYSFGQLCSQRGFAIPREINPEDIKIFPVVAKPKEYNLDQSHSPVIIKNKSELVEFLDGNCRDDFYIQEYIEGDSYYLLYSFDHNGDYEIFSQKNLIQQGNGKSIVLAESSTIHKEEIGELYAGLFKELNYFGVIMVEIKRANDGDYMIEANPRFWGPLQLVVDCNIPIIEHWIRMNGFLIPDIHQEQNSKEYLWLAGLLTAIQNKNVMFHDNDNILNKLPLYINRDIYLREDSYKYFIEEMKGVFNNEQR